MNSKLLQLNFSQLESAWKKTKNNHYSDAKKNRYQNKLNELFNKLNGEDFSALTADEALERSLVIDFFFLQHYFS